MAICGKGDTADNYSARLLTDNYTMTESIQEGWAEAKTYQRT